MRAFAITLLILAVCQAGPRAAAQGETETIRGEAEVLDGSRLEVAGREVRLYGIAAPRPGETCSLKATRIDCGEVAATQLMDLTAGAEVRCTIRSAETDPPTARCLVEDYDLSEGMVYTGWARPLAFAPDKLKEVQTTARQRRHGLWQGKFPPSVNAVAHDPQ